MLWDNAIVSVSCLLLCLCFGCAAHWQSQWWSHCQVSPSGLGCAKCSCTAVHICVPSCVVWPLCSLRGVAPCVSLHPVQLLCGQVSRGNVDASGLQECESGIFKMEDCISFLFFLSVKSLVCFNVSEMTGNFWSICDWLSKWSQVLISRSDWTLDPCLV